MNLKDSNGNKYGYWEQEYFETIYKGFYYENYEIGTWVRYDSGILSAKIFYPHPFCNRKLEGAVIFHSDDIMYDSRYHKGFHIEEYIYESQL